MSRIPHTTDRSQEAERLCLRCRQMFTSRGPYNRICQSCGPRVTEAAGGLQAVGHGNTGRRVGARGGHS